MISSHLLLSRPFGLRASRFSLSFGLAYYWPIFLELWPKLSTSWGSPSREGNIWGRGVLALKLSDSSNFEFLFWEVNSQFFAIITSWILWVFTENLAKIRFFCPF